VEWLILALALFDVVGVLADAALGIIALVERLDRKHQAYLARLDALALERRRALAMDVEWQQTVRDAMAARSDVGQFVWEAKRRIA